MRIMVVFCFVCVCICCKNNALFCIFAFCLLCTGLHEWYLYHCLCCYLFSRCPPILLAADTNLMITSWKTIGQSCFHRLSSQDSCRGSRHVTLIEEHTQTQHTRYTNRLHDGTTTWTMGTLQTRTGATNPWWLLLKTPTSINVAHATTNFETQTQTKSSE